MTVTLEYHFDHTLNQQIPERRELVLEKMEQLEKPFQTYIQTQKNQHTYSKLVAAQNLKLAILDFTIVAFLTLDCETKRTSEQIKERFQEIKEVQKSYQNEGIELGYTAIMMKSEPLGFSIPYPEDKIPNFYKRKYEEIAEKFLLLPPEEKQAFFQQMRCVAHHKRTQAPSAERQKT